MPKLHFHSDIKGNLELNLKCFFEESKKFPTEIIEGWLVFRGRLPGISPIVAFKMIDPVTGVLTEFFICNNAQYSFITKGLSPAGFKPGGIRRFMIDTLMETVQIPSKNPHSKIKDSLTLGLNKALKIKKKVNIQLLHVYKLKYKKLYIDHLMEKFFWEYYELKKARWKFHWKNNRNPNLKRVYKYYRSKSPIKKKCGNNSELQNSKFIFYLNDQSIKIQQLKLVIRNYKLDVYNKKNFLRLYHYFQSLNHGAIIKLKTSFTFEKISTLVNESNLGNLTDNYPDFISEVKPEGITRVIALIIQNKELRSEVTQITSRLKSFNFLDLSRPVVSEDKWGRIVTNKRNSVDFPDIITYHKSTSIAEEKIQVKVLPHIPTKFLYYRYEEILSDYIKSISCHDSISNTGLLSFRIEYIPKQTFVASFKRIPTNNHSIIINYWGKLDSRFQRFGEIYNAIRLGIYNYHISEKEELQEFVQRKLMNGTEMLSGRELLIFDKSLFSEIFSVYNKGMKVRQFIYQVLIKVIPLLQ